MKTKVTDVTTESESQKSRSMHKNHKPFLRLNLFYKTERQGSKPGGAWSTYVLSVLFNFLTTGRESMCTEFTVRSTQDTNERVLVKYQRKVIPFNGCMSQRRSIIQQHRLQHWAKSSVFSYLLPLYCCLKTAWFEQICKRMGHCGWRATCTSLVVDCAYLNLPHKHGIPSRSRLIFFG